MSVDVVVGGQGGDEGKAVILAYLALKGDYSGAIRIGGSQAGHSVIHEGKRLGLKTIAAGFINPDLSLYIGSGSYVRLDYLLEEIEITKVHDRLKIDPNAVIITEEQIAAENQDEKMTEIGSVKTGVGKALRDRVERKDIHFAKNEPQLEKYITDVAGEINKGISRGKHYILEGTQGTYLSLYHGTYPYCTSKDVCSSAICSDVGIGPIKVNEVMIVFKAYVTRVGGGELEGELPLKEAEKRGWMEYGTVTHRLRRVAPFNFNLAKKAIILNSATQIAITKIDVIYPECGEIDNFEDLSKEAKNFIYEIESETNIPVTLIGTGPSTLDVVDRRRK